MELFLNILSIIIIIVSLYIIVNSKYIFKRTNDSIKALALCLFYNAGVLYGAVLKIEYIALAYYLFALFTGINLVYDCYKEKKKIK